MYICLNLVTLINKFSINKLNLHSIYLVWLNNLVYNYLIFIIIYMCIVFFKINKLFLINFLLFFIIKKHIFNSIIKNFYFGFYKVHPSILYFCLTLFLSLKICKNLFFKIIHGVLLSLSIFTFFLGSFWALTDSIWGYYWTNDIIESLLLMFILLIYHKIHKIYFYKQIYIFLNYFFILINLNLLKFNFFFTKHSFIISNNLKFINFFFIIIFSNYIKIKKRNSFRSIIILKYLIFILIFNILIMLNLIANNYIKKSIQFFFWIFFFTYLTFFKLKNNNIKQIIIHFLIIFILILFNNIFMLFYNYYQTLIKMYLSTNYIFKHKQVNFNTYIFKKNNLITTYNIIKKNCKNLKNNSLLNKFYKNKINIINYF